MLQLLKLQHLLCEAKSKVPEYCPFNYERKDVKDGVVLFDCFPIMSEEAITLITNMQMYLRGYSVKYFIEKVEYILVS